MKKNCIIFFFVLRFISLYFFVLFDKVKVKFAGPSGRAV